MSINQCPSCEAYFDLDHAPTKTINGRRGHPDNWEPDEEYVFCPECGYDITDGCDQFEDESVIEELNKLLGLANEEYQKTRRQEKEIKDLRQMLDEHIV